MCFLILGFYKDLIVYWINYCKTNKGLELEVGSSGEILHKFVNG